MIKFGSFSQCISLSEMEVFERPFERLEDGLLPNIIDVETNVEREDRVYQLQKSKKKMGRSKGGQKKENALSFSLSRLKIVQSTDSTRRWHGLSEESITAVEPTDDFLENSHTRLSIGNSATIVKKKKNMTIKKQIIMNAGGDHSNNNMLLYPKMF